MGENLRFVQILDILKEKGVISDYVQVASVLKTNKAAISDIKGQRKKLSIELLRRLKLSYPEVNLEWVIMGSGSPFGDSNNDNPSLSSIELIEKISKQ
jgi:hypothetical protein